MVDQNRLIVDGSFYIEELESVYSVMKEFHGKAERLQLEQVILT